MNKLKKVFNYHSAITLGIYFFVAFVVALVLEIVLNLNSDADSWSWLFDLLFIALIMGILYATVKLSKKYHLSRINSFSRSLKRNPVHAPLLLLFIVSLIIGNTIVGNITTLRKPKITTAPTPEAKLEVAEDASTTLTPNTDPIVDCQFTYLPWQKMKSSECEKSFECQVGNVWRIYTSRNKCKQDQDAYLNNTIARPSINPNSQPSFDWSSYRASRIKDLKAALRIVEEQIPEYENTLAKITYAITLLAEDYQQGRISTEEYNQQLDKFEESGDKISNILKELRSDRDKYSNLIKRFENGENISPAEEKAILGY